MAKEKQSWEWNVDASAAAISCDVPARGLKVLDSGAVTGESTVGVPEA